ncbi:MAG: uroporphyrinogen-III C-methyltransferase [Lachnospiraceae bacterium]
MAFFPFFREIEGADGLLVGGGKVALRKAEKLLPYGPKLTVIAPIIRPEFYSLDVTRIERAFCPADITPHLAFVIAASSDPEQNEQISLLCRERMIPVNVVDQPKLCTFLFPSLVKRGKLSIGISTSGASPSAAVWLRKEIERLLPEQMEEILDRLQEERGIVKEQMEEESARSQRLKQLFEQYMEEAALPEDTGRKTADRTCFSGSVSLVGAGCGSREWITLEGLRLLRSCDAVMYDDLIDKALLEEAPPSAEKIYVGKRSHRPSARQEEIKASLAALAVQGKHVVRLKGGDPFVFGRGGEEIQYFNQLGIPWRVVPGISSALAIPEEAGIPVTHRGISRSIHIMTAHTKEDALRRDLKRFAGLEGTLVILMGLESLETIAAVLMENGKSRNTPAAVLSGGNSASRCRIIGTLETIAQKAREEHAATPAVIVIGNVVALDFYRTEALPLSGVTVGLTGTDDFQEKLKEQLLPLGASLISLMKGRCVETAAEIPWDQITGSGKKWIVFTSVQGIRTFFRQRRKERIDLRRFASCHFAVIGAVTGRELEEYGFSADVCPQEYTSAALANELLLQTTEKETIYLFCSRQSSSYLTKTLTDAGRVCRRFDIYDTTFACRTDLIGSTKTEEQPDYILFGSAGGVRALYQSGFQMRKDAKGVCIGPVCAEACRECFRAEPVLAEEATAEALRNALLNHRRGGDRP